MAEKNTRVVLKSRPVGMVQESDFELVEEAIPSPGAGQVLVHTAYLSVDPYMRGRINDARSYAKPVGLGETMTGELVGRVEKSNNPNFKAGDVVVGHLGWTEYGLSDGSNLRKVDEKLAPISTSLGVLGMPGLTAYFGYLDVLTPKAGETTFISGAAGAVGSIVGQIAKIQGCRAVGSAGGASKVKYLIDRLGFDAAFDYKDTTKYVAKLQEVCPAGIDTYFDNVGGEMTDAVMLTMNQGARIAICGQISQYNNAKPQMGPRLFGMLIMCRAKIQGFLVYDFLNRYPEGLKQLADWIQAGKIKYDENIIDGGIAAAPRAFIGLFHGENTGKQLVRVAG